MRNGNGTGSGSGNGNGNGHDSSLRILIADADQDHRNRLRSILSGHKGFAIVASVENGERAARLAAQLQPDVAILDMGMQRIDGSDTAENIAVTAPGCQLIILSQSNDPDMMRQAMLSGAREFLVKPVDEDHIVYSVSRVYEFAVKRQGGSLDEASRPTERARPSKVIAVWGPKGGVGRTFMAVNLAVSMAVEPARKVLLMDGCLGFCTADVALNIEGRKTILDLVVEHDDDLDPDMVAEVVVRHSSGIDVLLAPPVEDLLLIAPVHLQRILSLMRRLYDVVVVDTRPILDETTVAFLDLSDVILTICTPDIAALRNLRIFLDAATRLGYGSEKIRLVLNRADMRGAIARGEVEKVCRYPVFYVISNDHDAVAGSINHGVPLLSYQPQRPITREISTLASMLVDPIAGNGHDGDKAKKVAGLRLFARGVK